VQKQERGYRSSLAADPPGKDLNSMPEPTKQTVAAIIRPLHDEKQHVEASRH